MNEQKPDLKRDEQQSDTVERKSRPNRNKLINAIKACLSDNLRYKKYQGNPNKLAGHCYVASECFFHMDSSSEWKPMFVYHEGEPHWFLKHRITEKIIDPTAEQFKNTPPYSKAKGKGFLTKSPSRRCRILMIRVETFQRGKLTSDNIH